MLTITLLSPFTCHSPLWSRRGNSFVCEGLTIPEAVELVEELKTHDRAFRITMGNTRLTMAAVREAGQVACIYGEKVANRMLELRVQHPQLSTDASFGEAVLQVGGPMAFDWLKKQPRMRGRHLDDVWTVVARAEVETTC